MADDKTPETDEAAQPSAAPSPTPATTDASVTTDAPTTAEASAEKSAAKPKRSLASRLPKPPRGPVGIASLVVIALALVAATPYAVISIVWADRISSLNSSVNDLSLTLADLRENEDAAQQSYDDAVAHLDLQHTIIIDKVEDKAQAQDYFEYYAEVGPWLKDCADEFDSLIYYIQRIGNNYGDYIESSVRSYGKDVKKYCRQTREYLQESFDLEDEEIEDNKLRNDDELPAATEENE